ncbi:LysR substrate-binding domain-containing protein [Bradyrhizobium elkanii]|uniref:LysR substrate-binding domain-containing protein n=1 Tax=Bradyrhizobium elkanii TaxID=29448 RepID=UPI00209CC0E9|nr:LysR substrate-binding domain-containing protein [Bradyrhizobium elkanii]MCP1968545.1 LysR family glycine cleavage system transcriptional activator [Bradyrhizobium elkanii]MCS4109953.1 LysR family glycine cleavage system transcriptional activator [Bradyrhizobium elkanii]
MSNAPSTLPPLASLRAFEALARSGSVKLASESLNLTPSAISHQIRTLEAHFGLQLVQRSGRNIELTESGAIYAAAVLSAFNELFRASDLLEDRKRGPTVRVSVTPTFAMLAALPHLEKFRIDNPGLDLRLEAKNTLADFERDNIDAAVQFGDPPFGSLTYHRLLRSRAVPCADRKLLDRFPPVQQPNDLTKLPLIKFATAPDLWQRWFEEYDPKFQSKEPELIADSLLTAIQMARSSMGVILAPFPLVVPLIGSGALTVIQHWSSKSLALRDFYFTHRKLDHSSGKIKAVHKWLKVVAKALEADAAKLGV